MGLGMWMMSCLEAMGWRFGVIFEKKQWVEIRTYVKRYPLTPTTLSLSSNHVFFLAGRWSTSGWGGNAHFFTYTRIRSRETGENRKTNEQTKLGVTKGRGRCCNTICMCRLSLAWVTSENSTMLLGSDILRLFFTGPYLVSSPLCSVSGVDCPSVDPRQLPLLLSNYQLLVSCHQLPLSGPCLSLLSCHQLPTAFSLLSCPTTNSLSWVASSTLIRFPVPLPGTARFFCPRILCLVSRQNRQLNRLLWQPTPIVLHTPLSYPCHLFSINYNTI